MNVAERMREIAPFHVMELMAKAAALESAGRSIIHFEVGEPDFATAEPIVQAAQEFLRSGHVHYTAALGLPPLREAISGYYRDRHGIEVSPARIVVTAGASGALLLALGMLVNPGDEWLLPDPGYPCNRHFVRLLEGIPRPLKVDAQGNFQPTATAVARSWQPSTKGLMIASPANPTGTLIAPQELASIANLVRQNRGSLIVDEIYHGLTYDCDAKTALGLGEDVFVINSFSKYFGMTGWRLGWLVAPEACVRDIEKLAQNLYIAPSTVAQHAALAAFRPETIEILETRRREFQARRNLLLPGLERLGFRITATPAGAFYLYANCGNLSTDSQQLAERLLAEAGVAATPGLDFGSNAPESHMRFAYTIAQEKILEGLSRMGKLLA